ncbi:MAG: PhzF family phenazine biosynthesis protein [Chloroflexi bacterium]|jgi:PhzF family phenazine biosynthesis protein|nr:PhzF family phenazine biosynthesis protein [Anaerolineaceae bacterium]NLI44607.1 PhzF family phenazine biosynthesis protein [Chloroflexota bacterium]HOE35062.1 PhzF family phenazine biosynthesis protein [Anaerolineaceae bacterium]HOT25728.1 PhzF family phenazine biosynthesis protein [Anaerolineaceae bacterium]HQH58531.1 PhzF family phenazine biosynthesis protein [Anaerolineaceae bacterium]
MKIPIYHVDAFAVEPFRGNPAAVCLLQSPRSAEWMQNVAAEMALSETAFLYPKGEGYHLRWFTPKTEVELCGHATLASAHILYEFGFYEPDETIKFQTLSGTITASFSRGTIELDMPRRDPVPIPVSDELIEVLGQKPLAAAVVKDQVILAELADSEAVRNFVPDFKKIATLPQPDLIITAPCKEKYDFVSRFFSPVTGIPEDPVTGMAHCTLAPYYAERLNKTKFFAYQASARGGEIWVRLGTDRAYIGGKAVTVSQGDLLHQKD